MSSTCPTASNFRHFADGAAASRSGLRYRPGYRSASYPGPNARRGPDLQGRQPVPQNRYMLLHSVLHHWAPERLVPGPHCDAVQHLAPVADEPAGGAPADQSPVSLPRAED